MTVMTMNERAGTAALLACLAVAPAAWAAKAGPVQAHPVRELGLQIFVEKQPEWATQVANTGGRPTFGAQSPEGYPAPAVMTYMSWPEQRVADAQLPTMATSAIRTASRNFGLNAKQAGALAVKPASYGILRGYEATFPGHGQGSDLDVHIFVGQASGQFPVVMSLYTERGKIGQLSEQRQLAWSKLTYLPK